MRQILIIFIIFLSIAMVSCDCNHDCSKQKVAQAVQNDDYLDYLYTRAMDDAKNPEPSEIDTVLLTVNELEDTTISDKQYYKLTIPITQKSVKSFKKALEDSTKAYEITNNIWPFAGEELKEKIKGERFTSGSLLNTRVKQILGLPLSTQHTHLAEIWVAEMDIRRPCPNPSLSDTQCDLVFPENVDENYRKWFNDQRSTAYSEDSGFLFTQLGYTYDWGSLGNKRGISQFVVIKTKETKPIVYISKIVPISEYF